jgi:hypothetical protein
MTKSGKQEEKFKKSWFPKKFLSFKALLTITFCFQSANIRLIRVIRVQAQPWLSNSTF